VTFGNRTPQVGGAENQSRGRIALKRNSSVNWAELAYAAIAKLLSDQHAAVWPEIEAKLADRPQPEIDRGIDPHHLTTARRRLIRENRIEEVKVPTRGGREISVYGLTRRGRTETVFRRAAARKRLLETRYLSWTAGSRAEGKPNLIGEGGERVAHASP
jgi:hypothetical protein